MARDVNNDRIMEVNRQLANLDCRRQTLNTNPGDILPQLK